MADSSPVQQSRSSHLSRSLLNGSVLGLVEVSALALALLLGGLLRAYYVQGESMFAHWMWYLLLAWFAGSLAVRLLPGWGLGPVEELRRQVLLLCSVFGGTTALLFWGKAAEETSRLTLTLGFLLSLLLVPLARLQVKRFFLRNGNWGLPTVVYADAITAPRVIEALKEEQGLGFLPIAICMDEAIPDDSVDGVPRIGTLHAVCTEASAAIVAVPDLPGERLADLLEGPASRYPRVVLIPDLSETTSLWVKPRDLVGMLGLELSQNLLDPLSRFIKRTFDLGFTLLTLPVWIPLCLLITALIWIADRRNPFFMPERIGVGRRRFHAWKFRTMHPDAESILKRQLDHDAELRAEWERGFKLRRDPRVTSVGRILRRTSLDELPQLINVLRGDMSIVGPRPLPAYHYEELPERVKTLRERVRPGLTGLWRVSGRSEAGHHGMTKRDTYYVRNWSLWLDLVICFRTIRAVVSGHGAY